MGEGKEVTDEQEGSGALRERFFDLMWEAYRFPRQHPEAEAFAESREKRRSRRGVRTAIGFDEFGLALWTLQLMALKAQLRKGIENCKEGGKARKLLEDILHLLKAAFVNREIQSSSSLDVNQFLNAVEPLAEKAREALGAEEWRLQGDIVLELLGAYRTCLRERVFGDLSIDDGDYL